MKRFLIILLLIPAVGVVSASGETVFGGTVRFQTGLLVYPMENNYTAELSGPTLFTGSINAYSDSADFFFQPIISLQSDGADIFFVDQLYVSFFPADPVGIKVGRFYYRPGTATFFSVLNFFHSIDIESVLAGNITNAYIPNDMFQASLFFGNFFVKATAAPFPRQPRLIGVNSPWFPGKDVQETVSFELEDGSIGVYELKEITVLPGTVPLTLSNMSAGVEFGGAVSFLDFSFLYYHGIDPDSLIESHVSFPYTLSGFSFNLDFTPVSTIIDVLGLSTVLTFSGFRLALEGAFTFEKTLGTTSISRLSKKTIFYHAPFLEINAGISYRFSFLDLILAAEFTDGWSLGGPSEHTLLYPLTSSLLTGSASLSLFDHRLSFSEGVVFSTEDWSFVLFSGIAFRFLDDFLLELRVPIFFGTNTTTFGQFSKNYTGLLSLSWQF